MADIFRSAKSVFRRANHHITDLQSIIQGFAPGDKPYLQRTDHDPQSGKFIHKAIFDESFADDISCLFFDAVNNLRASLDQMTFAVAMKHRPSRDPEAFAPFPFASDDTYWPNRIKGLANDIPAEICAIFERFKPYKGGNDALWSLNYVANIKKHAILIPAGFGGKRIGVSADLEIPEFFSGNPFEGDSREVELCRTLNADLGAPIEFSFTVIVRHSEQIIDRKSPITLLHAMSAEVEAIIAATEAKCREIGLIS